MENNLPGFAHRRDGLVMRLLAVLSIVWAGGWLLLIVVPSGEVGAVDRGYDLMFLPFKLSGHTGLLVRRLVEFACLLPAAVSLVAAQAIQRRRLEKR